MPQFRNKQTGKVVFLEGTDAVRAVNSGLYEPIGTEDRVELETEGGRVLDVKYDDVSETADYQGAADPDIFGREQQRVLNEEERILQREHGGAGSVVGSFLEGGASALTFGGYDVLAEGLDLDTKKRARANPGARLAGEVTGLLGSTLATGGAGTAAGLGKLGRIAAKTPAGFVSAKSLEAGSRLGGQGLKGLALGQALEGTAYAVGQTTSQLLITDAPLTADAVFAEYGRNAAFGAGVGAAGAVLGRGLAKAGDSLRGAGKTAAPIVDLASSEGKAVSRDIWRAVQSADTLADDIARPAIADAQKGATEALHAADAARAVDEGLERGFADMPRGLTPDDISAPPPVQPTPQSTGPSSWTDLVADTETAPLYAGKILKDAGDEAMDRAFLAADPKLASDIAKLRRTHGNFQKALRAADEAPDKATLKAAHKAMGEYEAAVTDLGRKVDFDARAHLDSTVRTSEIPKQTPLSRADRAEEALQNVMPRVEPEVAATVRPGRPSGLTQAEPVGNARTLAAHDVIATRKAMRDALGVEPDGALKPQHINNLLKAEPQELVRGFTALNDYYSSLRRLAENSDDLAVMAKLDDSLNALTEATSRAMGGANLDDFGRGLIPAAMGLNVAEAAGIDTGPLNDLANVAALGKVAGKTGGKSGGLIRDAMARAMGRALPAVGRNVGLVKGGIAGSIVGGALAQTGYSATRAAFGAISAQRALAGTTGSALAKIGKALKAGDVVVRRGQLTAMSLLRDANFSYGDDAPKPEKPKRETLQDLFFARQAELARVSANPVAAQAAIHDDLAPLRKIAPYVADELEMISIAVPSYLADKMPKDPGTIMRFGRSEWKPSDYEVLQFAEHMKGALAPLEVIEEAMDGRITPQAAEALRALHPPLFREFQTMVYENSDELRDRLDYQAQVRLSVLTGVPVTSSMRPGFRQFMIERSAMKAQEAAAQQQQSRPAGGSGGGGGSFEQPTAAQNLLR